MKKKNVLTSIVLLTLFLSTILPIASTVAITENNPLGHSVESGRHLISVWNYTTNPSGGTDIAEAVAVDSDNNIIVVGYDRAISASDLQWRIIARAVVVMLQPLRTTLFVIYACMGILLLYDVYR